MKLAFLPKKRTTIGAAVYFGLPIFCLIFLGGTKEANSTSTKNTKPFDSPIPSCEIQLAYNKKHGITPQTIQKHIHDITEELESEHAKAVSAELSLDMEIFAAAKAIGKGKKGRGKKNPIEKLIALKESEMKEAVKVLDFETAAILRDEIRVLKERTYINP